jgi:hypothetical protein
VAIRSLKFVLTGEDRSAGKTFDSVGSKADRLGKKVGTGLGKGIGLGLKGLGGLALGAGAAGVAAAGMAPQILSMAGALEQGAAKAATVFGPKQIGAVDKWAKANAAAMGLTSSEATTLAAGFGDLLVPMGFTRAEAAKMSTDTIGLAGALSQWSGGTVTAADAADRLSAAMLGETDGLKSLGISISAADVEARLAAKGQDKLTGAARQQAEAVAIQTMIFEKSTDAQAAYKNGGSSLIAQSNKMKATFKELRDKGVRALAPHLATLLDKFNGLVTGFQNGTGAGGKLKEAVTALRERFEKYRPVLEIVGKALLKVGGLIVTTIIPAVWKMQEVWLGMVTKLVPPILSFFSTLVTGAAKAFGWVPGLGGKLKEAAKSFEQFKDDVNTALANIKDQEVRLRLRTETDARSDLSGSEKAAATKAILGGAGGTRGGVAVPRPASGGGRPLAADRVMVSLDGRSAAASVTRNEQVRMSRGFLPA